ncbi:MAG: glycosyltransferase [Conexivisphaerales archaeon]
MHSLQTWYKEERKAFSIGICTSGNDVYLQRLIELVKSDSQNERWYAKEIIVVASEISDENRKALAKVSLDTRFKIVFEEKRRGKYEAINRILHTCSTEYLVLINGDALPARGSIFGLLDKLVSDERLAIVSGIPVVNYDGGITAGISALMWYAHNYALQLLSNEGKNRHSCDELMAVRLGRVPRLPEGTVNDGAYMACWASINGYYVSYSPTSFVLINTPKRLGDLMKQRRRISYGHFQVWKRLGVPPSTVESVLMTRPSVGLAILSHIIKKRPKLIISIFPAIIEEAFSVLLATIDHVTYSDRHTVWRRYES